MQVILPLIYQREIFATQRSGIYFPGPVLPQIRYAVEPLLFASTPGVFRRVSTP